MQNHLNLYKDVRGCMTRFDPLTPEIVATQSDDGLTYDELKEVLEDYGMNIEKVSRSFQNAFFADFEQGHYCWIPFKKANLREALRTMDQQFRLPIFGQARRNHEWTTFYMMDVPLPMQIYDFERRYQDIEPEQVFSIWSSIHTRIDYANGMWKPEVLEYVFAHAPRPKCRKQTKTVRLRSTAAWARCPRLRKMRSSGQRIPYVPFGLPTGVPGAPDWFPQRSFLSRSWFITPGTVQNTRSS